MKKTKQKKQQCQNKIQPFSVPFSLKKKKIKNFQTKRNQTQFN